MSYKYYYSSVKGTSHNQTNMPKQDNLRVCSLTFDKKHYFISVVADGAGTAKFSDKSSDFLCNYLAVTMSGWLRSHKLSDFNKETFCNWIKTFHNHLKDFMRMKNIPTVRDCATTLLFAVLGEDFNIFAQIGDGAISIGNKEELQCVFPPQKGEYANTTHFITEENFEKYLMFAYSQKKIERIAMHTDGIEMISLENLEKPSMKFFNPFFDCLEGEPKGYNKGLSEELAEFLSSERVNSRTNDDKTLVIGVKEGING